jgi:uncharacterized membrane-anchored protein/uncharacterized membrane protein
LNNRLIQTGYLLGISLLLASILFFFASNWQGFERLSKVGLIIGLVLFFYGIHFLLLKLVKHQRFLSDWMLVASSITFGISVALIGQIYNSHADSYLLFLIWLVPVFLLAIVTRYAPFYILSYLLLHLTIEFYLYPTSYFIDWTEHQLFWMTFDVIMLNAILFYISGPRYLNSKTIKYTAFLVMNILFVYLTVSYDFPIYKIFIKLFYFAVLLSGFYYWIKVNHQRIFISLLGVFASIYAVIQSLEWVTKYYGEWTLFYFLLLAVVIVISSVKVLKIIGTHPKNDLVKFIITMIFTFTATVFATSAIFGLFFLLYPQGSTTILFFFSLIALVVPGLFTKWPIQVKYTILATGFLIATGTSLFADQMVYRCILFVVLGIAYFLIDRPGMKIFHYLLLNLMLFAILTEWWEMQGFLLSLLVLNTGFYFIQTKDQATRYLALLIAFSSFISLTVIDTVGVLTILYNISFFLIVTVLVFMLKRDVRPWEWLISIVFWFLFIGYKYYDLAWTLVNKSILFLIIGLIFLAITVYFEKKQPRETREEPRFQQKWLLIVFVIILQVGFVFYQATTNEMLIKNGTSVKVKLAPVDPRSMLQGDYFQLSYDISTISDLQSTTHPHERVKVVLRENNKGVYEYAGYIQTQDGWNKPYVKQAGDVAINGRINDSRAVIYGFETFFVPEGEGIDLQRHIRYGILRVGKTGNAIIEDVK